jgi:tetratricopeptide (TPR) repeat protein
MAWSSLIPPGLVAWQERRRALRELDTLEQNEALTLASDEGNLVNLAKTALAAGDPRGALQFWEKAKLRHPLFVRQARESLDIMLGLHRFEEAESEMLDGQKRAPGDPHYAEGYALVAERRGDIEEAIRRWTRVRKRFPGRWMGHVHGASCLCRAGDAASAEKLIARAIRLFPNEVRTFLESATIAEHRHEWPTAIRRWELVCEKFRHVHGDVGVARGLEELGRFEAAEQRLKEAQGRHPMVPALAIALARTAGKRGDAEESVRRWAEARRRFPLLPFGYQDGVRQLLAMDRHADAEAILLAAIARFPAEAWPAVEYASVASTRQDWAAAAPRWDEVRSKWPDRQDGYRRGMEALAALERKEEVATLQAEHQRRFG